MWVALTGKASTATVPTSGPSFHPKDFRGHPLRLVHFHHISLLSSPPPPLPFRFVFSSLNTPGRPLVFVQSFHNISEQILNKLHFFFQDASSDEGRRILGGRRSNLLRRDPEGQTRIETVYDRKLFSGRAHDPVDTGDDEVRLFCSQNSEHFDPGVCLQATLAGQQRYRSKQGDEIDGQYNT